MEAYLDNAASTRPAQEVVDKMLETLTNDYGNPSARHIKGVEAENYIKAARGSISKILKCRDKEIIFTSGATESNNTAIFGAVNARKRFGTHIITTAIEHASVRQPFLELEKIGFDVTFLPVSKEGIVDIEALKEALREDTILVSVMHVNNEVGSIQPVEEIGRIVKAFDHDILYHVDGVQAFGKIKFNFKDLHADFFTASGHKFHGPKGTGFLYLREGVRIDPLIYGGGQQFKIRSGTENVPGIAGMGAAASLVYTKDIEEKLGRVRDLRDFFTKELKNIENVTINGASDGSVSPHIVSATFDGIRSEVLLHALEERNIYVSSGSACSSNRPGLSFALGAMGIEGKALESTIRFSFSFETNKEELKYTLDAINELVPFLRQFVRK